MSAQALPLENGRRADTQPGAKLDVGAARGDGRRINGGQMDRRSSTRRNQTTVVTATTVVRRISGRDAAQSFAQAARGYTPRQLADAADVTIEAAKFWLEAKRAPSSANLLNMARTLPFVMEWFLRESGGGNPVARSGSLDGVVAALREFKGVSGPQADLAHAILHAIEAPEDGGE